MTAFPSILAEPSSARRLQGYHDLAAAALAHYTLEFGAPEFLQHNSGITYRVPVRGSSQYFLLKIHDSVGEATSASAAHIDACMAWLAALAELSPFRVQTPVPNRDALWVSEVFFPGIADPLPCTLQSWVPGEHAGGDLTLPQIEAVGAMMAQLHRHSAGWNAAHSSRIPAYDTGDLSKEVAQLRIAVRLDLISAESYQRLERTSQEITRLAKQLGRQPAVWGAVHGDLHQDNLVFEGTTVHPIDFDALHVTYYLLDLSTTLYHILYLEAALRAALVESYRRLQPLPAIAEGSLELFVTWAAIRNLAFQSTIPGQRSSPLFARNVRQLVNEFCPRVLDDIPFVCADAAP